MGLYRTFNWSWWAVSQRDTDIMDYARSRVDYEREGLSAGALTWCIALSLQFLLLL